MKFLRSKRGWVVIAAVLLALFLFRPGVTRLRNRIARSIGSALGRQVALENVRVHLLPRPGFDLEGLVISDNPAFSAEPMVRAQEVDARIRISSLFRGRLEIATLSATEPSINLVRNSDGHWNLESLLERSVQSATAPTGKPVSEHRPAFPYLEATHARVNLKLGQEKKSYALSDADLALWQDSENSWAARITAQPVRTDFNLTDTGRLRINATWQRAGQLGETPVRAALRWENGQLGQITKLFSGRDRGWRGAVTLAADLSGSPEALLIHTQLTVDDFHRYDISGVDSVRLAATCSGKYSTTERTLREIACDSPIGVGALHLDGIIGPITANPAYNLTLIVDQVPVPSLLRLVRQGKKGLPRDLVATGQVDAEFRANSSGTGTATMGGAGSIADLRFAAANGREEISFGDVPLTLIGSSSPVNADQFKKAEPAPSEPHLRIGPFPLGMAAPAPATVEGWLAVSGYRFSLRGETRLSHVFQLADAIGLPGARPGADGLAAVDLNVAGSWQGFSSPTGVGTAQLHNVRAEMRGIDVPVEIAAASVVLDPETVSLRKISATTGATHWTGTVTAPRHCPAPACVFQFDLGADQLSTSDLNSWFVPHPTKRPWYRILTSAAQDAPSPWLSLRANGIFHANRLGLKKAVVTRVSSRIELDRGRITLTDLRADLLDGSHRGNWVLDASSQPAVWQARGTLQGVSLAAANALIPDGFITGTGEAKYELAGPGGSISEFLAHADGTLQFSVQNGALRNLELPSGSKPFPVHRFRGELRVRKGAWELQAGKLESRDGIYQVSGIASSAGGLDFVFLRGDDQKWNVTGTLAKPRVVPATRTQAETTIKPEESR